MLVTGLPEWVFRELIGEKGVGIRPQVQILLFRALADIQGFPRCGLDYLMIWQFCQFCRRGGRVSFFNTGAISDNGKRGRP